MERGNVCNGSGFRCLIVISFVWSRVDAGLHIAASGHCLAVALGVRMAARKREGLDGCHLVRGYDDTGLSTEDAEWNHPGTTILGRRPRRKWLRNKVHGSSCLHGKSRFTGSENRVRGKCARWSCCLGSSHHEIMFSV